MEVPMKYKGHATNVCTPAVRTKTSNVTSPISFLGITPNTRFTYWLSARFGLACKSDRWQKTHESPSWQPVRTQAFTAASWAVHADAAECSSKITERLMPRLHRKRKRLNKNSSSDGAYPCNKTTAALSSRTLAAYIARQFLWRTLTQREKGRRQASEREHVRLGIPSL